MAESSPALISRYTVMVDTRISCATSATVMKCRRSSSWLTLVGPFSACGIEPIRSRGERKCGTEKDLIFALGARMFALSVSALPQLDRSGDRGLHDALHDALEVGVRKHRKTSCRGATRRGDILTQDRRVLA